VKYKADGTIDT